MLRRSSMQQFKITSKILPDNWLDKVQSYDLSQISSEQNRKFTQALIAFISTHKEESLSDLLVQNIAMHICTGESLLFDLSNIPPTLLDRILFEIKSKRKFHFSEKLVSIFAEVKTYQLHKDEGYVYSDPKNKKDVTDLTMSYGDMTFDIQVKNKQSNDTFLARIRDYILGMALILENDFLRGQNFQIFLMNEIIGKGDKDKIWDEVSQFITKKSDCFSGKFINIENTVSKRTTSKDISEGHALVNSCLISDELMEAENIIDVISEDGFIGRQINELKKQYGNKNIANTFIGVIVWDAPFHKNLCVTTVESVFNEHLSLSFDLRVILRDKFNPAYDFLVKAKMTDE